MRGINEYHEGLLWRSDEDGVLVLGYTQDALDSAGTLSGVDAAEVGDEYQSGDWIGEIRGQNGTVAVVAPCDLRIVECNQAVIGQPTVLEDDPTGDAWILRAEPIE